MRSNPHKGVRLSHSPSARSDPLAYACNHSEPDFRGRPNPVQYVYSEGNGGATAEGLFAMAGNVAEWVEFTDLEIVNDVLGRPSYLRWRPASGAVTTALAYGGSFTKGLLDCRVTDGDSLPHTYHRDDIGFRLFERRPPESGK